MNYSKKKFNQKKAKALFGGRILTTTILLTFFLMPFLNLVQAQDDSKNQSFLVHEDPVYPFMVAEYERIAKELVENCKKYKIQDLNWITSVTEDFRYIYVSPIKNMADLDKNSFATLLEKMGEDSFNKLFDSYNKCYDKHFDYIITLDKDLSYMPDGITQTPEGLPYRRFINYYVSPKNFKNFLEKGKEIKDLFVKKGSKVYYRIYRSGFGARDNFVMVAIAAKSPEEYERLVAENQKLLGEEGQKLFVELLKYTLKYESTSGLIRPDLAYTPK